MLYFPARNLTFTVPLSTLESKWVPTNCQRNLANAEGMGVTCSELASYPQE